MLLQNVLPQLLEKLAAVPGFVICGALVVIIWGLYEFSRWATNRIAVSVATGRVRRTVRRNTSSHQVEESFSRWGATPRPERITQAIEAKTWPSRKPAVSQETLNPTVNGSALNGELHAVPESDDIG